MNILILAGGKGTRLWPRCTPPKQFHSLGEGPTLLQRTLLRFLKRFSPADMVIIVEKKYFSLAEDQAYEIHPELKGRIACDRKPQGTTPAIVEGLNWLTKRGELSECFLIAPSDHLIQPEEVLLDALDQALVEAKKEHHVLFGVLPKRAETRYGYIEYERSLPTYIVTRFIEKPPIEVAENLLLRGNCLWHTGIALFHTQSFLLQLPYSPLSSIDCALLETVDNLKVFSLQLDWSDVGTWEAIYEAQEKDAKGNVIQGDIHIEEAKGCLIIGHEKPVSVSGVDDLIIIDGPDGLLITSQKAAKQLSMPLSRSVPSKG